MASLNEFGSQWVNENLSREASDDEIKLLNMFLGVCNNDIRAATKRARNYYKMRGAHGLKDIWHHRHPDKEDILKSCQQAYIVPLRVKSVGGRRLTIAKLPAPQYLDQPLSTKALLARWLMVFDLMTLEADGVSEEVTVVDVGDLQAEHFKRHFQGNYWKNFFQYIMSASPLKFAEIHIVNTGRLRTLSLFMLKTGAYPWKRKITKIHHSIEAINQFMGLDYFPLEGLPFEYGGKAGAMKDLNDEWTKKLLMNSKWFEIQEIKFKETILKPEVKHKAKLKLNTKKYNKKNSYTLLHINDNTNMDNTFMHGEPFAEPLPPELPLLSAPPEPLPPSSPPFPEPEPPPLPVDISLSYAEVEPE